MMKSFSLAFALLVSVVFSGCEKQDVPALQAGKACKIQFRRDALGAGANLPISPTTDNMNGADTSVAGTLKRTTAEWIVIEGKRGEIWIPKSVILLIEQ